MSYITSFFIVIVSIAFSAVTLSNVLLPIFYTIPQLRKERIKNNIIKKIPIYLIIWPPIFYSIVFVIGFYFAQKFIPHKRVEIIFGIALSLFLLILRTKKRNSDMTDDFKRYFKDYLKSEQNLSNINNITKFDKSAYYVSETELKSLIIRAFEKYTVTDYRSAIAIYDKILDLNPLLTDDLAMRAQCLERLNYNLDAIDDYELAISINDSDGNWFGLLGLVYLKIGNLDKAELFLKISVQKGWKMYEPNLKMIRSLSNDNIRQEMSESITKPEKLTRRNKNDFEDDLSEIDRIEYNANLIKSIQGVNRGLALDPENAVLKELHNNFYSKLN